MTSGWHANPPLILLPTGLLWIYYIILYYIIRSGWVLRSNFTFESDSDDSLHFNVVSTVTVHFRTRIIIFYYVTFIYNFVQSKTFFRFYVGFNLFFPKWFLVKRMKKFACLYGIYTINRLLISFTWQLNNVAWKSKNKQSWKNGWNSIVTSRYERSCYPNDD